ncbi:uncharacterized protein LOC141648798 [Silene latifolia]|uniref:uncharacterized protein LOC141648798 n=1 Tax=Silene latifolia TaxID=37657 RepID=UPI003D76EEAF
MKAGSRAQWQMNNFQTAVDECRLRDVPWEGYTFTYDNGQVGEANRQCRLDRALCTETWLDLFPYAKLFNLDREWSDHAPLRLAFDRREIGGKTRSRFRFEQIWVGEEGCEEAIVRGVEKGQGDLVRSLKKCGKELFAWKKIGIGKIGRSLDLKRKQLARINEGDRTEDNVRKRKKLIAEIASLYKQEEQYWRQRSRALWLKDGDRNTKFFHSRAGERKRKNFIGKLIDDSGRVANEYFRDLFTSAEPTNFENVLDGIEGRVTEEMNRGLQAEYSEAEIIEALNQMHPLKAPGPDASINKTNIVLIPKKKAPDKIRDYRPISLCNVAYKLVSKVLANRLKVFLGDIISKNQNAFMPGRLIFDNILIAFELFHHMKNKRQTEGYMAIKLDMAKAYDRVEWGFLRRVLMRMGFDPQWIQRVMDCVSTVTFSVLINGSPSEDFQPARGLRQGDPLSPYLFLLCAEVLSNLLRKAAVNGSLHDDSIFFVKVNVEEADVINDILRWYEGASGQLVSLDKTTVSFSKGVDRGRRSIVAARLGVVEVEEQARYLVLPTVIGRSKKVITDIIRDKLCKKLQGWRGKILSRAGKEILIKAIANSLPTYVMSVFKIHANFCNELRSIVSKFWWGHEENKRGIFWVSWSRLARPKGVGGMGFRDFRMFNLALLGKQAWRLITNSTSLWSRLMQAKYFPDGDFMSASLGHNPSYTWRSIFEARSVLEAGLRRRIGDGNDTKVWGHAWIPGTQTGRVISPCVQGNEGMVVAELLTADGRGWDEGKLELHLLPFERERVCNIRLSSNRPRDMWYWGREKDGIYTVRSAYKMLVGEVGDMEGGSNWVSDKWLWKRLWKVSVWPRVKLFFWQMCSEALATRANIAARIGGEYSLCPFCHSNLESSIHLFRDCGVAAWVWEELEMGDVTETRGGDIREWVEACWNDMYREECVKFMVGCWAIWEHRNKVIFDNVEVEPGVVASRVRDVIREGVGEGGGTAVRRRSRGSVEEAEGWRVAKEGYVKINVDAGIKEAEAVAILDGLEEAARRGIQKLEVESDCLQVIEAIRKRSDGRSIFAVIIDDIVSFRSNFLSVCWLHVNRVNNCVAHALAHCIPRTIGRVVWEDGLPPTATATAAFDQLLIE